MARVEVNHYSCKLRLIRYGLLQEAEDIDNLDLYKAKDKTASGAGDDSEISEEEDGDHIVAQRNTYVKKMIKQAGVRRKAENPIGKTEATSEARRAVIKEFLLEITKGRKCHSCQG